MCIIMYHRQGIVIPEEQLDISAFNHPHGCGIMYVTEKGKLMTFKTMDATEFKSKYRKIMKKHPQSPIVLHYRKMTEGSAVMANCHPFVVDKNHAFVHNGTIYPCKPHKDAVHDKSDTLIFLDHIMKRLPKDWFANMAIEYMLFDYIGRSKLAIMDNTGEVRLIGEKRGENEHKAAWNKAGTIWYSNQSYHKKKSKEKSRAERRKEFWEKQTDDRGALVGQAEWFVDGVSCRWCATFRLTEAYDRDTQRWRTYLPQEGRFAGWPHTCKGHTPLIGKKYRETWDRDQAIDEAREVQKRERGGNVIDMSAKRVGRTECSYCGFDYSDQYMNDVTVDGERMEMCDQCLSFVVDCDNRIVYHF